VAAFPQHGENVALLVRVAESALFEAKRLGRNRVIVAAPISDVAEVAPMKDDHSDERMSS